MFDKMSGLKFKASIKIGAPIAQDHGYYRWPEAAHPRNPPVKFYPEIEFDAEMCADGRYFDLRRPGYGILGGPDNHYGNGSIFVTKIDDLAVSEGDRKRVIDFLAARKQAEIDAAAAKLAELHNEKAALVASSPRAAAAR